MKRGSWVRFVDRLLKSLTITRSSVPAARSGVTRGLIPGENLAERGRWPPSGAYSPTLRKKTLEMMVNRNVAGTCTKR